MKKVYLLFAFVLSLVGIIQLKAETLTEGFESVTLTDADGNALTGSFSYGYGLSNGWKVVGGSIYASAGYANYGLWTTAHTGSKSLEASSSATNAASVVITEKLTGTFTFWARKTSSSSSTKGTITLYEATEDNGTYTVTSTSLYTNSSLTTTWTKYSVDLGVEGKYVAINMVRAGIDDIEAEIFEEGVEKKVLGINAFEAVETTVNATTAKKYTANFSVTVENKGNVDLAASEVKVTLLAADKTTELASATATADLAQGATTTVALSYDGDADADQTVSFYVREDVTEKIFSDAAVITVQAYGARFAIDATGSAEDYGFIAKGGSSSKIYTVTNSGNAALAVSIVAPDGFTVAPATLNVAGGATGTFSISLNTDAIGAKSGDITLTTDALDVTSFTIPVSAYVYNPDAYYVDFNDNQLPQGWETAGWTFSNQQAYASYGSSNTLISPILKVAEGDVLVFQVKANSSYAELKVSTSTDGGETWTDVNTYSEYSQNAFTTYELNTIPAGSYKLKFTGVYTYLDNINGFALDENAPVLAVTRDDAAVADGATDDFGKVKAATTHTYTVSNTGTGTLSVAIASSDADQFTVSTATLEVGSGESKTFDVAVVFNETYGAKAADITITPEGKAAFTIHATATTADPNVWEEDFESGVMPDSWTSDGWTVSQPYGKTSYVASAGYSDNNTLITPRLYATEGQKLQFEVIDAESGYPQKVEWSHDRSEWTLLESYTESGVKEFTAPEDGNYYLRFSGRYTYVDNFYGFKLDIPEHDASIFSSTIPATGNQYVEYTATVSVKEMAGKDETVTAELYIGDEKVATTTDEVLAANDKTTITLSFTPETALSGDAYIKVYNDNIALETEKTTVTIAAAPVLDETVGSLEGLENWGNYAAITLKYSLKAGWNTIILPFAVSDLSVFGEGVKAYKFNDYADDELSFGVVTELNAQQPYVIYATDAKSEVVFKNVTSVRTSTDVADLRTTAGGATLQGTYVPLAAGELTGKYGVLTNGRIQKGGASATIAGFRAYFELPAGANDSKLSLVFDEGDGTVTAIKAVDSPLFGEESDTTYNLNGQKVNANYKGIVIQNGKKVVKK